MPRGNPKGCPPNSGSFQAGKTGNPGGRPKTVPEVRELAKVYTVEAIETLAEVMRDKGTEENPAPSAPRVAAANALLDRGHGKAPVTFEPSNYDVLTDAELERVIADTIAELQAIGVKLPAGEGARGKAQKLRPH